jgi:pilus assembly protein Flp/PilA
MRWQTPVCPVGLERDYKMTKYIAKFQARLATREQGATAVEYGLMVALIAIVIIAAVTLLGGNLKNLFNTVATSV